MVRKVSPNFIALLCLLSSSSSLAAPVYQNALSGLFLHLTDIHPDEFYVQGSTVASSCHSLPNITSSLIDIPKSEGGYYGTPDSICDSPFSLVNATFDWIDKHLAPEVDFVVWTGDNARHDSDNTHPRTQDEINTLNQRIAQKFLDTFGDPDDPTSTRRRVPVVPSIGNNDVYPHNIMSAGPNPMLQTFAKLWSEFIPAQQINTFRRGGYYSSEVVPGKIAVVALNTLHFYIHNAAVNGCVRGEDEPGAEEMDWLEAELDRLRDRGLLVYLTGHIPPEVKSYTPSCHTRYIRIALAYQDIIVGHLYGHANIDHFFLLSDRKTETSLREGDVRRGAKQHRFMVPNAESIMDENEVKDMDQAEMNYGTLDDGQHHVATSVALSTYLEALWVQYDGIPNESDPSRYAIIQVSPSMIPTYNPTLRVFSYQLGNVSDSEACRKTKKKPGKKPRHYPPAAAPTQFGYPLAYTQYWCNLSLANKDKDKAIEYEIEYRTEDYGLAHLGTEEWLTLAQQIEADKKLKSLYLKRMVVQTNLQ
ncbi:Endopolyphosphatase [Podila minutissima]|nr:Endopolyphosphatase [Podila minutissima]